MPMLKTEVVVTEWTKIDTAPGGSTIGQLIDDKIADYLERTHGGTAKEQMRLGAIEFSFESDADWHEYAHGLATAGITPRHRKSKATEAY